MLTWDFHVVDGRDLDADDALGPVLFVRHLAYEPFPNLIKPWTKGQMEDPLACET